MSDRIKIYIEKSKQYTTAILEFRDFPLCGKHHRSVLLKDIKDLKMFRMPSSVKLLDIEANFYIQNLDTLICYDTAVFDHLLNKINKESEEKSMLHNVTITKTEEKVLEEYYLMRGMKEWYYGLGDEKKKRICLCDREVSHYPDAQTIAQFLSESGANFVTVEHNYRFVTDLPFC